MRFRDRRAAGRELAQRLAHLRYQRPVVLGLPRGGVVVAHEVAATLHAPLDVIVVRKIAVPDQPELAVGAVGENGVYLLNHEVVRAARVSLAEMTREALRQRNEVDRRAALYRGVRPGVAVRGRTVIVVDDGIATGTSVSAAVRVVRAMGARRLVLAVPVAPPDVLEELAAEVDEVVCLRAPSDLLAVGSWYREFGDVGDNRVVELLRRRPDGDGEPVADLGTPEVDQRVEVVIGGQQRLPGRLTVPAGAGGVVVFADGSPGSRHSPRYRRIAADLNAAGLGTLLFDLLRTGESAAHGTAPDVTGLADRLVAATDLVHSDERLRRSAIGYFGTGIGAAAALWAAGAPDTRVRAVVSRGGCVELAQQRLCRVSAPTLFVVGGQDERSLQVNRRVQRQLRCPNELVAVPGADALFADQGALERVAQLAAEWFTRHFAVAAVG